MSIRRVQTRQKDITGYINCMRGTWLGNPFPVSIYGEEKALSYHKSYLKWWYENDEIFYNYLHYLAFKSKTKEILLGCGCKPENPCHVDSLIEMIESIKRELKK